MSSIFLKLLNMSITASWLILAVILARLLLKKAPKWIPCVLWGLVAVRLICPFSLESVFSLIPSSETIPSNIALQNEPHINSGITVINEAVNPVITESFAPALDTSVNPLQVIIPIAAALWIAGIVVMLAYALVSYLKLKKTVSVCVPIKEGILSCDEVKAPFILGVLRPVIYVPSSMQGETLDYVLRHETAHLQRRDHWWKPLGFLLLSVYWFNPLCWIAYILLCRDIEMACDERVIRDMDKGDMAAYSQALLDCSFPRKRIAACPLAFGEVGVKERVKGVLNYKKPAFWILCAAVVACVVLVVCFLTNPNERFRIDREQVEKVTYYNLFIGDECQGKLNAAQTDEMVQRFSAITHAKKDNRYEGQTPGYQLCAFLKNGSFIYANGYHATDDMVEIIMNGSRYSVSDSDFANYLRNVCSGGDVSPAQQADQGKFYLTIGADGVKSILITAPYFSGGCENADGSLYQMGEQIWLEALDGREDLRGLTITALDENGTALWTASVPDTEDNRGFTRLTQDGWTITNLGGTPAESTNSPMDLDTLRAKYPEYFDLDTFKGLEVYVWQMAPDSYSCGVLPGTNRNKTLEELMNLKGASLAEMRAILSTYDIDERNISVIPWQNPVSSYIAEYWISQKDEDPASVEKRKKEYIDGIRQMLFGNAHAGGNDFPNPIVDIKTTVAYANWTEGEMMHDCLNGDKMIISSVRHLPVYKLDTKEDLERFIENYKDTLTLDQGYDEVPSFDAVTASYDDSFFADHTVIIAYVAANSGSFRYAIRDISYGGSTFCLNVVQTNNPKAYTDDMAGWFVIAEVLDSDITGYTEYDAQLVNIRTDVCELYLEVLEDLWNVDSGLNSGISQIGIDLSELSHLTELEKDTVMHEFASKHNLPFIAGTWEELCEQGYIDKENLYWEDGLFFSIKTNENGDSDPERTAFDAQKWRSGLGAYFFGQCTAQKNADGKWSYTVGQEAIS